jgi:NIMA (never in mitosis gene a)-related kinase
MNKTSTLRDFEVLAKLGEGSFSSVFKVRRVDDKVCYALKKVRFE